MITTKMILTIIIAATTSLTLAACSRTLRANQDNSAQTSGAKDDSVRALLEIFANQPDYTADVYMMIAEPQRMKVARKEGKLRREFLYPVKAGSGKIIANAYRTIIIERPGQSTILFEPQKRTYCEIPAGSSSPMAGLQTLVDNVMSAAEGIRVKNLGTEILDGHETIKMRITMKGDKPQSDRHGVFFYFATDLKNLFIKMEVLELYEDKQTPPGKGWSYALSNISLDVPANDLFQVPAGYQEVDLNSFLANLKQHIPK